VLAVLLGMAVPQPTDSACCCFSAKGSNIVQPAQDVFISWDPQAKIEALTVQPHLEGNALDFGLVFVTPAQPKVEAMPKDFFRELAVFTLLKHRENPMSNLMPQAVRRRLTNVGALPPAGAKSAAGVKELEAGISGSLNYKIVAADKANELYGWLKENNYNYAPDEATLDSYIQKKWFFTVMKIDTRKLKKNPDGTFTGDVTPTRLQFATDKLIFPLKIMRPCVRDKADILFYVQAPTKVDLPGDLTYQYMWVPMLEGSLGQYIKGAFGPHHHLPGKADDWLKAIENQEAALLKRAETRGFEFTRGQRPEPNPQGRTPTTPEWAGRLGPEDIRLLKDPAPYSESLPNVDEGYTQADIQNSTKAPTIFKVVHERLEKYRSERPGGYLLREAPAEEVKDLKILVGQLKEGQFLTKFRKIFTKGEMDEDLLIVPAQLGQAEDTSEYEEYLPTSPP
jgi:hypothetical protein